MNFRKKTEIFITRWISSLLWVVHSPVVPFSRLNWVMIRGKIVQNLKLEKGTINLNHDIQSCVEIEYVFWFAAKSQRWGWWNKPGQTFPGWVHGNSNTSTNFMMYANLVNQVARLSKIRCLRSLDHCLIATICARLA